MEGGDGIDMEDEDDLDYPSFRHWAGGVANHVIILNASIYGVNHPTGKSAGSIVGITKS